jgi:L-gulonate 3-dehydrogenase
MTIDRDPTPAVAASGGARPRDSTALESDAGVAPPQTVGLVGAGTVGFGWATLFLRSGIGVRIFDSSSSALTKLERRLSDGGHEATVTICTSLEEILDGVAYVQESVPEDRQIKRSVFEALAQAAPPEVILASSTSTFPIGSILTEAVADPERCLVVHPTNPPHVIPFVEIVPGERTSAAVVDAALALMRTLGQSPIVCRKEIFGFVLNRLQFALVREAFFLLREGVASVADIDTAVSEGLGLRWAFLGPFGVEATNASSLAEDLEKFAPLMRELMATVCQPFDGPTSDDIDAAVAGFDHYLSADAQKGLADYRDRAIHELLALKRSISTVSGVDRRVPLMQKGDA